jgi:hypothetical protein
MEKALGQKAWAQFDAHVQKEKLRMCGFRGMVINDSRTIVIAIPG